MLSTVFTDNSAARSGNVKLQITDREYHEVSVETITGGKLRLTDHTVNGDTVFTSRNAPRSGTFISSTGTTHFFANDDVRVPFAITVGCGYGNVIRGTGANDVIRCGNRGDRVDGGAGNDKIYGNSGADWLFGGAGNDTIYGGAGNDQMWGGSGADYLDGQGGSNTINSTPNQDRTVKRYYDVRNGTDNTDIPSGWAYEPLFGTLKVDMATALDTRIIGSGPDAATVTYKANNTCSRVYSYDNLVALSVFGTNGPDTIDLSPLTIDVTVNGRDGNDVIRGGSGNDNLIGGGGNNTIYGGEGADRVDSRGGTGTFVDYTPSQGDVWLQDQPSFPNNWSFSNGQLVVDMATGTNVHWTGSGNSLTVFWDNTQWAFPGLTVLTVFGTEGADTIDLSGMTIPVIVYGRGGDDTIRGGSNNDLLVGGAGNNTIYGGQGADVGDLRGGTGSFVDYNPAEGDTRLMDQPVTPTLTWAQLADIVFGTPLGAAEETATSNVPGTFSYSFTDGDVLHAGSYTLTANFTPLDTVHYTTASIQNVLDVLKATPTIVWANPADITVGTPLGAAQLNATANVTGAFVYTPGAGTMLSTGNGQVLSVSFTPTNSADYNVASATVQINVLSGNTGLTPMDVDQGTQRFIQGAVVDIQYAPDSTPAAVTYLVTINGISYGEHSFDKKVHVRASALTINTDLLNVMLVGYGFEFEAASPV
jgi:hypothetical protein